MSCDAPTGTAAPTIPPEMLREANRAWEIRGFVRRSAQRDPLVCGGVVAGFVTPHWHRWGWRLGPIWVAPAFRGLGLVVSAYERYRDRVCVAFVADANVASARCHERAGFVRWRRGNAGWFMRREPSTDHVVQVPEELTNGGRGTGRAR